MSKKKVAYFYDAEIGNYYYGQGHPMKPHRMRMTHNLVLNYQLYSKMLIYRPRHPTQEELTRFHSDDYIEFLRMITPENMEEYAKQLHRFNVGEDCPVFDGLYQFCQKSAGGSIGGAQKLNAKECDIAINWAGGLHHAKKGEASGFCYVNDIVLAILELLKHHQRVLYIDIDIHHGDGVEEAFYLTDRVMTLSFHKFGDYFPGTGDVRDIGAGQGKHHALNFPLKDGVNDETFESIFNPIVAAVMTHYRPEAVVIQCGADSLAGDRLGCFNLSIKGHGQAVSFVKSFNLPTLVLGGGGYTIRNVSRCWTYETALCLDTELADELPHNDYLEYYGPEYKLQITPSNMKNLNTRAELEDVRNRLLESLRSINSAPSVARHNTPRDESDDEDDDEEARKIREEDRRVEHSAEYYEDDASDPELG